MHVLLTTGAWLLLVCSAYSQTTVSGKVTSSEDASPLPGVNILVKGTADGTISDAEGNFNIRVPSNESVLVFSFVGYLAQEVPVSGRTSFDVTLASDAQQLSEVVVTALGIEKNVASLGYGVQKVLGNDLVKAREPNAINSLVGKVAGLTIGASAELLRRPNIQLRGNAEILFVVDGVPVNSDTWNVSPDDIESYTVLKGPNASALYGFRGRNGAIIVTTKKGSKDSRGFSVEFSSSTMMENGFLTIPKVQDEYGPGDHGNYSFVNGKGGGKNDNDYDIWGPALNGQLIAQYDSPVDPVTGERTPTPFIARGKDNLKRFLQPGILSSNNVAVGFSSDKADIRFSATQSYQRGILPNTKLNITNFNTTLGYNFNPKLRFEANINYNRQYTNNIPDVNYGPNSMIYNIMIWGAADWDIDQMKNYWQPGNEGVQQNYAEYQRYNNPWFLVKEWLRGHYKTDIIGSTSLRYKFNDNLEATLRTQVTTWNLFRPESMPTSAGAYGREERGGDYREDRRNLFENNTDLLIRYNKQISSNFKIETWAGAALRTFNYNSNFTTTDYLNVPASSLNVSGFSFNNSRNPVRSYSAKSQMQVGSAYYSIDLSYKDFINLSTTGRLDNLSTLPKGNRSYFYPSVSLSTVVSDYVNFPHPISFIKVRASYANVKSGLTQSTIGATPFQTVAVMGTTKTGTYPLDYGNEYFSSYDGPSYNNSATYSTSSIYNNQPSATYTKQLNNQNIKADANSSIETGLDMRFFENRLGLEATYYVSELGPQIFSRTVSEAAGFSSILENGITTQRKGLEISINGSLLNNSDGLNWSVLVNWSHYRETLKEILPDDPTVNSWPTSFFVNGSSAVNGSTTANQSSPNRYIKIGDRVDGFYGSAFARDPNGNIIHAGGKATRSSNDQFLGYVDPDFVWGFSNKFSYKSISFSFQIDGRVGGVIQNYFQNKAFVGGRHIETVQGEMGIARANDVIGVKSYVGDGVVASGPVNFDVDGNIINYDELQFTPNTEQQYLQDYLSFYYNTSEANMMSRSFAKLREVTLGYSLPKSFLGKNIRQVNLTLVARNLLYFAKKKDMDIDQFATRQGTADLQTPTTRRYGFNLNIVF